MVSCISPSTQISLHDLVEVEVGMKGSGSYTTGLPVNRRLQDNKQEAKVCLSRVKWFKDVQIDSIIRSLGNSACIRLRWRSLRVDTMT